MYRLDAYSKLPWEQKADGRFWTHITLGEVGVPLKYYSRDSKGSVLQRTEVVTEEGLFNDESVRSLPGLPILLKHPPSKTYRLNQDGLKVGTVLSNIAKEDGKLIAEVVIDDHRGVELITKLLSRGLTPEASSGYLLRDLKQREDGIYEQFRGSYDHVAAPLMPGGGRGGQDLVLRFDSEDAVSHLLFDLGGVKKKVKDIIVRLDEKEQIILKDVPEDVEEAIAKLQSRCDTLLSDLEGVEERIEELEEENEQLSGRLDANDIGIEIQARLDAWEEARVLTPELKVNTALSVEEIRKSAIALLKPNLNLDGKSEGYIEGIWEGLKESKSRTGLKSKTDEFLESTRSDSVEKPKYAIAYENAHRRNK
ncbi:DUF2213 domain-containing protein [Chroococcidiopsis sp.]|uniref:DUF2213 domain-containing protein n=1 Tax=Chroococcidiopsis sp. TaxID=3088168 RepID=UPI003F407CBA